MFERVKESLREKGELTFALEARIDEFARHCILEMNSEDIRNAVLDYLENVAPLEFFSGPVSYSGKYHPSWQSLVGGILLNTTECCIGIDRKMRMYPDLVNSKGCPQSQDRDIIYAATILSDTFKPIEAQERAKGTRSYTHHRVAAEKWREVASRHRIPPPVVKTIADAIYWHLGRFTPDWPQSVDPRTFLTLDAFITHELDMDFSNRNLEVVFERKGAAQEVPTAEASEAFLDREFDTASSYFEHIESKLLNLVTFYVTLILAVLAGIYHVSTSDTFAKMSFWIVKGPRAFFIGIVSVVFFLIGAFLLGMYTELRTRKILMLEEMARIREYFIESGKKAGRRIGDAITMVSGILNCPQYLRRPSEDWYTILLMIAVGSIAIAFGLDAELYAFAPQLFRGTATAQLGLGCLGILIFAVFAYLQFRWVTTFCFLLDCRREKKYGASHYGLMPKHSSAFPLLLGYLDRMAAEIERRKKQEIFAKLESENAHP
jgi:hypothetical protein